ARPARSEGRGETILVVDDEPELVTLAEDLLASLGYEPVGFRDARAALDAFDRDPQRFRAVLTDERMPTMRGAELAARIHERAPQVPVILMTGHRNTGIEVNAARAGIVEILDKPLNLHTLQAALDRELSPTLA
ncbi:MAG: response regulator, partial [Proteobacteria bacterium]|nr:response regulator [Pseudomonadota bacterium]